MQAAIEREQAGKAEVAGKIEAAIRLNEQLKCQIANMKTCNENLTKQNEVLNGECKEMRGQLRNITNQAESAKSERDAIKGKLVAAQNQFAQYETNSKQALEKLKGVYNEQIEIVNAQNKRLEEQISQLNTMKPKKVTKDDKGIDCTEDKCYTDNDIQLLI